jgi:hypothetical protein
VIPLSICIPNAVPRLLVMILNGFKM